MRWGQETDQHVSVSMWWEMRCNFCILAIMNSNIDDKLEAQWHFKSAHGLKQLTIDVHVKKHRKLLNIFFLLILPQYERSNQIIIYSFISSGIWTFCIIYYYERKQENKSANIMRKKTWTWTFVGCHSVNHRCRCIRTRQGIHARGEKIKTAGSCLEQVSSIFSTNLDRSTKRTSIRSCGLILTRNELWKVS